MPKPVSIAITKKRWRPWVARVDGCEVSAKNLQNLRAGVAGILRSDSFIFAFASPAAKVVDAARAQRLAAKESAARAQELLRIAADALAADGVNCRDAGELLGVTFQRVHQLTTKRPRQTVRELFRNARRRQHSVESAASTGVDVDDYLQSKRRRI